MPPANDSRTIDLADPTEAVAGGTPAAEGPVSEASEAELIRQVSRGSVLYWLLMATLTLNLLDRQVINVLGQAISQDLRLSDSQLGLLGGIGFSLVYFLFGFPWGWAADRPRNSRVWLIAGALAFWSSMTALCGLTQTYGQLLLARMGVAAGEAGCSPAAKSLIADCAPRARLAGALAIFGLGIPIGAFLGKSLGGVLADLWGWRSAFMIVGAPGLILAVVLVVFLKDPRTLGLGARGPRPRGGYGQALREILRSRTIIHGQIAITLASSLVAGGSFWGLIHFQRNLGLSAGEAGVFLGVMGGIAGLTGTLGGGWLADRLARRRARHYFTPAMIGMLASPPLLVAAFAADAWWLALILLVLPSGFDNMAFGGANAAEQQLLSPEVRASASAILTMVTALLGMAIGVTGFGVASDLLRPLLPQGAPPSETIRWVLMGSGVAFLLPAFFYWRASRHVEAELAAFGSA